MKMQFFALRTYRTVKPPTPSKFCTTRSQVLRKVGGSDVNGRYRSFLHRAKWLFFNFSWKEIGTRTVFKNAISRITGIHIVALNGPDILKANSLSIAQKMSWAADRETTRPEDLAYFLLGVFSVNMPIIYGEGEKAFQRLQLEIMKFSDDQSILAWQMISQRCLPFENIWVETSNGPLATSPADFAYSGEVKMCGGSGSPHTMTNRGLHIELKLIPISLDEIYKRTAATSIGSYGSRERKLGINFYQA